MSQLFIVTRPSLVTGFQLAGGLDELGRHHLAGGAPGCPEVHHDGDVIAADVPLECGGGQLDRMMRKQGTVTLATVGTFAEASRRDAVHRDTMRTDNMYRFTHVSLTKKGD